MLIKNLTEFLGCKYHDNLKTFKFADAPGNLVITTSLPIDYTSTGHAQIPGLTHISPCNIESADCKYMFVFNTTTTAQWVYEALQLYRLYNGEKKLRGEIEKKYNELNKDKE